MVQRLLSASGSSNDELTPLITAMQQALVELAAVSEKERQSVDNARRDAEQANQNLANAQTEAGQRIAAAQERFDDAYRQAAAVGRWPVLEPHTPRALAGRQRRSQRSNTASSSKRTKTLASAASDMTESPGSKVPVAVPVSGGPSSAPV